MVALLYECGADIESATRDGRLPADVTADSELSRMLEPLVAPCSLLHLPDELIVDIFARLPGLYFSLVFCFFFVGYDYEREEKN